MKKIFIPVLFLMLIVASSFGLQPSNKLMGIWELQMDNGPTGLLKIFNADGTTTSIGLAEEGMGISLRGTYELKSESAYQEKIIESAYSEQNGTQKLVTFKITGDSVLHLSYKIDNETYNEEYKKLKLIQH